MQRRGLDGAKRLLDSQQQILNIERFEHHRNAACLEMFSKVADGRQRRGADTTGIIAVVRRRLSFE